MNFKVVMEATIYEAIIMLTPLVSWRHQNNNMFVYVNAQIFWLLDKLLMKLISRLLMTTTFGDDIIRIIKFLFVWMLNASVYLIYCCHISFEVFVGATIYELIIMYSHVHNTLMTIIINLLMTSLSSDMNLKAFVEAANTEFRILLIPVGWLRYQNREVFVYLNAVCFC